MGHLQQSIRNWHDNNSQSTQLTDRVMRSFLNVGELFVKTAGIETWLTELNL